MFIFFYFSSFPKSRGTDLEKKNWTAYRQEETTTKLKTKFKEPALKMSFVFVASGLATFIFFVFYLYKNKIANRTRKKKKDQDCSILNSLFSIFSKKNTQR